MEKAAEMKTWLCAVVFAFLALPTPVGTIAGTIKVDPILSGNSGFTGSPNFARFLFVTPKDYGAKGDATAVACTVSSGSKALRCANAVFSSADVSKPIVISGAASGGNALVTTLSSVTNASSAVLAASASSTVTSALTYYGTDDTAAVRSCVQAGTVRGGRCTVNDGLIFMVSNTASTIAISGATLFPGGMIDGTGTLVFAPQGALIGGTNDRLFYAVSTEAAGPFPVAGAVTKGATFFATQNSRDAAQLSPLDWVIVTEQDAGASDVVYTDWVQISSVIGATVNIVGRFRMTFPNARSFNASGSPAPCIAASPCGLSFRKLANVVRALTIKDIHIVIPRVANGGGASGIVTRDTRGVHIHNVTCTDASQNCYAGYLDQGLLFTENHMNSATYPEFASQVDTVATGNQINQPIGGISPLAAPTSGGLLIDFGTGFSTFHANTIGDQLQSCLTLFAGVHHNSVSGNRCGWTHVGSAASCILMRGSYSNAIEHNFCAGGEGGASVGITAGDSSGFTVNIPSALNSVRGNIVNGYAAAYDILNATDLLGCDDDSGKPCEITVSPNLGRSPVR
jgi:hypothetical protein